MAWAHVQSKILQGSAASSTTTITPTSAITSGNRMFLLVGLNYNGTLGTLSIGGTNGLTWTLEASITDSSNGVLTALYSAPITTGGGTTPTFVVTHSLNTWSLNLAILEYSGLASGVGAIADKTATVQSATATTAAPSGTTAATTGANELVLGIYVDPNGNGTAFSATGCTVRVSLKGGNAVDMGVVDRDSGASGTTQAITFTVAPSNPYSNMIGAFKLASSPALVVPPRFNFIAVRRAANF